MDWWLAWVIFLTGLGMGGVVGAAIVEQAQKRKKTPRP